jgi:transposase
MLILAIDLGKAKSVACWYQTDDATHEFRTVPTRPADFHTLLADRAVDRMVIEICDAAGWIVDLCRTLAIPVQVANTNQQAWRWKNVKNKCDREDGLKLARLSAMDQLCLVHVPEKNVREWRSLILYRHKLIDRRTSIRNAIHSILVAQGQAMPGRRSVWSDDSMSKLLALARPLSECNDMEELWRGHLQMELEQLDELCQRIVELDDKLDAIGHADQRVRRLRTIPGVGPRLSELVVAMIDDPHRFKSARQVSAYAGLVPRRYQSGEMDRSGRISKAGCGKLRKLLVEIAWGMLRHNPHGAVVFNRISKGQKTRRKQAAVALGRKVLCWCWAMLRDGSEWRVPMPHANPMNQTKPPLPAMASG